MDVRLQDTCLPHGPGSRSPAVVIRERNPNRAPRNPDLAGPRVLRVLVADNCHDTADSLAMLVERWGHHVRVAYDGLAARDLAGADRPDVLLLDLGMPGLDGCALARRLRHRPDFKASIMIAVTGYADEEHRQQCEEAGFNFSFVKPVAPAVLETLLHFEQTRRGGQPADAPAHARLPGILVIDDDAAVRGVVDRVLRHDGLAVWLAADGMEALQQYWRHGAAIDVVLLDVRMPGLDGPQTLAALREINPLVRCCFMTGDAGQYTDEALRACGAVGLLHKPFDLAEVGRMLRQLAAPAPV